MSTFTDHAAVRILNGVPGILGLVIAAFLIIFILVVHAIRTFLTYRRDATAITEPSEKGILGRVRQTLFPWRYTEATRWLNLLTLLVLAVAVAGLLWYDIYYRMVQQKSLLDVRVLRQATTHAPTIRFCAVGGGATATPQATPIVSSATYQDEQGTTKGTLSAYLYAVETAGGRFCALFQGEQFPQTGAGYTYTFQLLPDFSSGASTATIYVQVGDNDLNWYADEPAAARAEVAAASLTAGKTYALTYTESHRRVLDGGTHRSFRWSPDLLVGGGEVTSSGGNGSGPSSIPMSVVVSLRPSTDDVVESTEHPSFPLASLLSSLGGYLYLAHLIHSYLFGHAPLNTFGFVSTTLLTSSTLAHLGNILPTQPASPPRPSTPTPPSEPIHEWQASFLTGQLFDPRRESSRHAAPRRSQSLMDGRAGFPYMFPPFPGPVSPETFLFPPQPWQRAREQADYLAEHQRWRTGVLEQQLGYQRDRTEYLERKIEALEGVLREVYLDTRLVDRRRGRPTRVPDPPDTTGDTTNAPTRGESETESTEGSAGSAGDPGAGVVTGTGAGAVTGAGAGAVTGTGAGISGPVMEEDEEEDREYDVVNGETMMEDGSGSTGASGTGQHSA